MIRLVAGDTVLVKHPKFTDGEWKKTKIYVADSGFYEIRFSTGDSITVGDNVIIYDCDIIKVDSDFEMKCSNCKYRPEPDFEEPCYECLGQYSYWEPCDSFKNKDKLNGNDIKTFSIDEGPFTAEFMADFNKKENKNMKKQQRRRNRNILVVKDFNTAIEFDEIKFNGPATIIKWKQTFNQQLRNEKADKTVTVCKEPDKFDKTTGFLLAVLKEVLDNKSYGNILEKIDEFSEQTVEPDLNSKHNKCPKETIALLNEAAEAMNNAFHIGSRVKYIHGGLVYMVVDCAYIPTKHEMYYTLSTCQNDILSGHETHKVYNVAHHRLKQVKRW